MLTARHKVHILKGDFYLWIQKTIWWGIRVSKKTNTEFGVTLLAMEKPPEKPVDQPKLSLLDFLQ